MVLDNWVYEAEVVVLFHNGKGPDWENLKHSHEIIDS